MNQLSGWIKLPGLYLSPETALSKERQEHDAQSDERTRQNDANDRLVRHPFILCTVLPLYGM
jgi:hypothetical protein